MEMVSNHVPSVAKFECAIQSDPEMVDLFEQLFVQASSQNEVHLNPISYSFFAQNNRSPLDLRL